MGVLDGATAVVTGGGGALGRACAPAIADAGAAIIVSLELKGTGVRMNRIEPGATDSALWRLGRSEEEIQGLLAAGNILQPAEFADVVVRRVSDPSRPLSGEFIANDPHRGSLAEKQV